MFWWLYFTTADVVKYTERPLIIWLQGGPGCASTGLGNFQEIGPLNLNLKPRNFSVVKEANVLFIDSPVGTGFSYVEENKLLCTNNTQIARDLLQLMHGFYQILPEFKRVPLIIASESYGGKMATEFCLLMEEARKTGAIKADIKALSLGDPWISPIDSVLMWADYLFQIVSLFFNSVVYNILVEFL